MTSLQTAVKNKPWPQRTRTPLWSKRAGGVWGEAEEGRGRERGGGAGWMICSWNMEHMKTKKKDKWHKAGQPRYSRCWRRGCSPLALCQVPGLQSVLWSIVTQHGVRSLWAAGNRVLERGQFNLPKKQIWLEKKQFLLVEIPQQCCPLSKSLFRKLTLWLKKKSDPLWKSNVVGQFFITAISC